MRTGFGGGFKLIKSPVATTSAIKGKRFGNGGGGQVWDSSKEFSVAMTTDLGLLGLRMVGLVGLDGASEEPVSGLLFKGEGTSG